MMAYEKIILHKIFDKNVKKHLSQYREKTLNIKQCGIYKENGKPYEHILPDSDWKKIFYLQNIKMIL